MAVINFTIPNNKIQLIIDSMKGLYPIPQIPDPDFVGNPDDAPFINEFTDIAWAKESVRRWIRDQVARWIQKEAIGDIKFSPDDTIIT